MVRILLDCYGLDKGYKEVVKAGVKALKKNKQKDVEITFVGRKNEIEEELKEYKFDSERVKIINAEDEISCNESPTVAIKQKTNSSLVVGLNNLKEDYDALISGGSTGAVLTGGFLKIGRIKGVSRPALCPMLPTVSGDKVMIIDCGANADCKPINLVHFAIMANIYMKSVIGINNPRIGLLSNGEEEHKGNELTKETYPLLKQQPINFIGNIEAKDVLSGKIDVVVCDGFSGNVLLKGTEGAVKMVLKKLKAEIKDSLLSKIGAIFMKKTFNHLKKELDVDGQGGSILIGLKKTLIKVHGSCSYKAIMIAINQAREIKNNKVLEIFEEEFSKQVDLIGE